MQRNSITLRQIRESHSWKREYERTMPLSRFVYRPIGFLLTWAFIRLGISTEVTSYLSGVLGLLGSFCLVRPDPLSQVGGIVLLHLFNLLDCVDGSIARATGTSNAYGKYLDTVIGDAVNFAFFALAGILAFRNPQLTLFFGKGPSGDWTLPALGGGISFCWFFLHHVEGLYRGQVKDLWERIPGEAPEEPVESAIPSVAGPTNAGQAKAVQHLLRLLDRNLRARETHYLLFVFAYLGGAVDLFLVLFLIYFAFRAAASTALFGGRALAVKRLHRSQARHRRGP